MLYSPAFRFPARKPTGAKLALKPFHVWGTRIRLQVGHRSRDLALFDLALDSKLRGCDLVQLKVSDLMSASGVKRRVMILKQRHLGAPQAVSTVGGRVQAHERHPLVYQPRSGSPFNIILQG